MKSLNDVFWLSLVAVALLFVLYLLVSNVPTKWSARAAQNDADKKKKKADADTADDRVQIESLRRQRNEYMQLWEAEATAKRDAIEGRNRAEFALAQKESSCARVGQPCLIPLLREKQGERNDPKS